MSQDLSGRPSDQSGPSADQKFATRDPQLLKTWDEIQRVQVDFSFQQEISIFYMSDQWIGNAQSVLDVGTGNGYFLRGLCDRFPRKRYTGIDISAEFIETAERELAGAPVDLAVRDFFDASGAYDFVIMRLFWQHLREEQLEEAFCALGGLTRGGGSVFIVDACDALRRFVPGLPEFQKVIAAYTEQQRASGRNRDVVEVIAEKARASTDWRIGSDLSVVLPSTIPGNLDRFRRIYELWIQLFEVVGELEMDLAPAKAELERWRAEEAAYTQAGLRIMRLDRVT